MEINRNNRWVWICDKKGNKLSFDTVRHECFLREGVLEKVSAKFDTKENIEKYSDYIFTGIHHSLMFPIENNQIIAHYFEIKNENTRKYYFLACEKGTCGEVHQTSLQTENLVESFHFEN